MTPDHGDPLLGKWETLRTRFFGEYHAQVLTNRRFYDRQFSEQVVKDAEEDLWVYIPETARRAIDEAADHLLFTPRIRVPVRPGDSITEQKIAERKRQF